MKIYTEVNYIWKDDKLVQTDSKSFEYDGEIDQCHKRWNWHTHASINQVIGGSTKEYAEKGTEIAKDVNKTYRQGQYLWDTIKKGPKGSTGQIVDSLYGGTFKDWVKQAQGKGNEGEGGSGNTAADDQALADLNYSSRRGFQGKGKGKKVGTEDMRREPYPIATGTLLTPGQKAKKLGPR